LVFVLKNKNTKNTYLCPFHFILFFEKTPLSVSEGFKIENSKISVLVKKEGENNTRSKSRLVNIISMLTHSNLDKHKNATKTH
jgi:hypothetical protein